MLNKKVAFLATSALVGAMMVSTSAFAQSTATTEVEEVVVTGSTGPANLGGVITAETAPKAKSSIGQEFISTQVSGQTIVQSLNLTPGLNFTNSDPYGSSGGNLRIRGFDGNRISLTFDGIPLNDTGNYAVYTNQQIDSELIERASVNLGTTDVDSPTASASGGTINYTTRRPSKEFGGIATVSGGSWNYGRVFAMIDTGEIGPWGTAAWVSGSYQKYDKFKGEGDLEKKQFNAKVYQPIGDNGDFISLGLHWNENRNAFLRTASDADFKFYGRDFDNLSSCTRQTPVNGTKQDDGLVIESSNPAYRSANDNPVNPSSCTNFYGLRINPSNTGNIRGQSRFTLTDNLHLTVDPSFQYTLANGGGSSTISESDAKVRGVNGAAKDLNGDGDTLDVVRFYTPNTTNTRRYGLTSSLIWDINPSNTVRLAYTLDYGRHRQTGEWNFLDADGNPGNVFGGKDGYGQRVYNSDGYHLRQRDRFSIALLNQVALEYRGRFIDDRLAINVGIRAPFFKRELNQYCYTQNSATGTGNVGGANVNCTSQAIAQTNADGTVQFFNVPVGGNPATINSTRYIKPFSAEVKYDKVLPNLNASFDIGGGHSVYASYSQGLSVPRTDNLYTVRLVDGKVLPADVAPEESKAYDIGWRYKSSKIISSVGVWYNDYTNRIVTAFDPDAGISVDRNVGGVKLWGVDAQIGYQPTKDWTLYASASYTNSELQDDLFLGTATAANGVIPAGQAIYLPTKGKELVETPEWMFGARAEWDVLENLHVGLQGKFVGKRFATDVNDEESDAYKVFDLDIRYDLPFFNGKTSYVQLNVTNLFDEEYYGTISSANAKNPIPGKVWATSALATANGGIAAGNGFYGIAAPRTVQVTFRTAF